MRRIVTSHDDQGQPIVSRDTQISTEILPHGVGSALIWSSDKFPAQVTSPDDKGTTATDFITNGSVFRIVDIPPRNVGALHRTVSLDYIIVQTGSVTLTFDNGSKTKVNQGEFVIQQATMHAWDNESDEWARLLCIMLPAAAPVVGGKELQTDVAALFGG